MPASHIKIHFWYSVLEYLLWIVNFASIEKITFDTWIYPSFMPFIPPAARTVRVFQLPLGDFSLINCSLHLSSSLLFQSSLSLKWRSWNTVFPRALPSLAFKISMVKSPQHSLSSYSVYLTVPTPGWTSRGMKERSNKVWATHVLWMT